MKLWKRRPLSEDLTWKDINIPNEMPPALVYISPGNQKISKRSSLRDSKNLENHHQFQDLNSFQMNNNNNEKNVSKNCNFQTFHDYEMKNSVKFNENTLKSSNLSNKDCKSYLPPVYLEWSPVKDVMKICRSASLPFHSRDLYKMNNQENVTNQTNNSKTSNLSLSEKIKIFFRNRSSSRSSKTVLESITEKKSPKTASDSNKILKRTSRSRTKENERCKSLYDPSRCLDKEILNSYNHGYTTSNCQSQFVLDKKLVKHSSANKDKKNEKNNSSSKKEKSDKKFNGVVDHQKSQRNHLINPDPCQRVPVRGFSASVVSHTTSSAAKCKTNSPKISETSQNILRNKKCDRICVNKTSDTNESHFYKRAPIIYDSSDFYKSDSLVSQKPPQATTAPKSDKKIANLNKSDISATRSARFESVGSKQKGEYLISNRVTPPLINSFESRLSITVEPRKYVNNVTDDDYVTLAEVNMSLPPNGAFVTQSLFGSVLPTYSNVNQNPDTNDINLRNQFRSIGQHKEIIYQKNKREITVTGGEIRKRPISCMAVVNADNKDLLSEPENHCKFENINPKSPYLSQYSKLYSLRANDIEMVPRYGNELSDLDLMTRSLHSGYYKTPTTISKDQTGKLSIDSGLVDDINAFHPDTIQQTQNY